MSSLQEAALETDTCHELEVPGDDDARLDSALHDLAVAPLPDSESEDFKLSPDKRSLEPGKSRH